MAPKHDSSGREIQKPALPVLKKMLADTTDINLLTLFWCIHAIQDGRASKVKPKHLAYPKQAVTTDMTSPLVSYKWELETLITLMLNHPKTNQPPWLQKSLLTHDFNAMADLANTLRTVEDEQSAARIDVSNIMLEMHRIGHRQFQWQQGWGRAGDIYRYLFIYGQGECADYFYQTNGVSLIDFVSVAFAFYVLLQEQPWAGKLTGLSIMGLDDSLVDKVLPLLADEIWNVRRDSLRLLKQVEKGLGVELPIIYQPSYLRVKPILRSGAYNTYIAPLPELILMRATVGLYYDVIRGGTKIINDANARFEEYARHSIKAQCPAFDPAPAVKYTYNKNDVDTPDVLLKHEGRIVAVFECKATKLTFEAQYGDDPVENARNGYAQMAKAIFQLWKFFSHVRRGIINLDVAEDAVGVVLTMDAWTQMGGQLRERLFRDAEALAAGKDKDITEEDKRHPVFCAIHDLDELLATSSEEHLLTAFKAATTEKYKTWGVREVRQEEADPLPERKPFPFDLGDLFPWWKTLPEGYRRSKDENGKTLITKEEAV